MLPRWKQELHSQASLGGGGGGYFYPVWIAGEVCQLPLPRLLLLKLLLPPPPEHRAEAPVENKHREEQGKLYEVSGLWLPGLS